MDKYVIEEWREKVVKYPKRSRQSRVRALVRKRGVLLLISMAFICAAAGCAGSTDGEEQGAEGSLQGASDYGDGASETAAQITDNEEIPYVNILEADSTKLTITWDGMTENNLAEADVLEAEIMTAVDAFSAEGYSTGFLLYDLNSGGGISYNADEAYYSASTIKGPYVAWLVQAYPETADTLYGTIENTLQWSSNEDYERLITSYGYTEFNIWAAGLGCQNIAITDEWYTAVNARDFALLWSSMYDYFLSETCNTAVRDLYTGTLSSAIYETLGGQYTVYSKAGWIGEGPGSYYNVQNDAGIVMKGEDPYVLVVLSDAYGRLDLLDHLVAVLDMVHTSLTEY